MRRSDSDSDLCLDDDDYRNSGSGGDGQRIRRNSINRVSIRVVSDDRNTFFASYKNRD